MMFYSSTVAILFMGLVVPLWLVLRYMTRWRQARGLSDQDERMLTELYDNAQRMEDRLHTLEAILDAEAPGWRKRV